MRALPLGSIESPVLRKVPKNDLDKVWKNKDDQICKWQNDKGNNIHLGGQY